MNWGHFKYAIVGAAAILCFLLGYVVSLWPTMADPARFELTTSTFGGQHSSN